MKDHINKFHPFMPEVMQARLSIWKWSNVRTYDEGYDSEVHIKSYLTQANPFSNDLRVHYRLFPTTLVEAVLEWCYSLPPNSVDSFETLCARFTTTFADSKPMVTCSMSLQHVTQGDTESLRQYMTQFSKATLGIFNLHPAVTMN